MTAWPARVPAVRLPPRQADRLLAAALLTWALFDVPWWWRPPGHAGSGLAIAGTAALAVVQSAPFLWRRQQPAAAAAVTGAALAAKYAAGLNTWSASAAVLAAAYGLGAYGGRAERLAARLLAAAAAAATLVALPLGRGEHGVAEWCAMLAAALVLGSAVSSHRDAATAASRHAHDAERARLAREVHDVLAHQLSAIAVQAGAARLAAAADPGAAAAAIAAIEQQARGGLTELNRLVRGLRPDIAGDLATGAAGAGDSGTGDGGPPRLADLPGLVQRTRQAGLRAELSIDGEPRPLAAEVELVGFRVVQESLTNSIRYAPGAAARVCLAYRADGITVNVTDSGPGGSSTGPGRGPTTAPGGGAGLAGLHERARLLGGSLRAGTRPEGGFAVCAFLPDRP